MLDELREGHSEELAGEDFTVLDGGEASSDVEDTSSDVKDRDIPGHIEFIDAVLELIRLRKLIFLSNKEDREVILSNIDKDLRDLLDYTSEMAGVAQ